MVQPLVAVLLVLRSDAFEIAALRQGRWRTHLKALNDGLVLSNRDGVLGEESLGGPVVHYYEEEGEWTMWFHGRGGGQAPDAKLPPISTGRIGMARSKDGLTWERVRGIGEGGSVLAESDDWWTYDTAHVGLGDVVPLSGEIGERRYKRCGSPLAMYYFGGSNSEVPLRSLGIDRDGSMPAMDLRIGVAVNQGEGELWGRVEGDFPAGEIISVGQTWDSAYVGWPSVAEFSGSRRIYYQAFDVRTQKHAIGVASAVSTDGIRFRKESIEEPVFAGSGSAFDSKGVSRRCVRPDRERPGAYKMWYEALGDDGTSHSFGLATSTDGRSWTALPDPVFEPNHAEDGSAWDSAVVSAPYVVRVDDNTLRMYYAGAPKLSPDYKGPRRMAIGAADSLDEGRTWTRVPSTLAY